MQFHKVEGWHCILPLLLVAGLDHGLLLESTERGGHTVGQ